MAGSVRQALKRVSQRWKPDFLSGPWGLPPVTASWLGIAKMQMDIADTPEKHMEVQMHGYLRFLNLLTDFFFNSRACFYAYFPGYAQIS